jgi:hypothetical protein
MQEAHSTGMVDIEAYLVSGGNRNQRQISLSKPGPWSAPDLSLLK